jgi:hypothetical protein
MIHLSIHLIMLVNRACIEHTCHLRHMYNDIWYGKSQEVHPFRISGPSQPWIFEWKLYLLKGGGGGVHVFIIEGGRKWVIGQWKYPDGGMAHSSKMWNWVIIVWYVKSWVRCDVGILSSQAIQYAGSNSSWKHPGRTDIVMLVNLGRACKLDWNYLLQVEVLVLEWLWLVMNNTFGGQDQLYMP